MYGALRAPTSNCVVLLAQGETNIRKNAVSAEQQQRAARRISGYGRTKDNWYSRSLIVETQVRPGRMEGPGMGREIHLFTAGLGRRE
jgi:hypothetical protein